MVKDYFKADCNVAIYKIEPLGEHRLIRKEHNSILTSGLASLVKMANGAAFEVGGFGLGTSSTPVQVTDTWLKNPALVTAPTSFYFDGPLFRATLYLDQTQLNGTTITEAILAPSTIAPPSGEAAYSRVVFPGVAKSADYSYLIIHDCLFGV